MSKPNDATLKELVQSFPADWVSLLGGPVNVPVDVIDADVSTVTAAADKVLRVGADPPILWHIELQASYDTDMAERILLYNTLLQYRHRLPVRSVVVLLHPDANSPRWTGQLEHALPGELPYQVFRYEVVRMWQEDVERFLAGGIGPVPLAPLCNFAKDKLPAVVEKIRARLEKETTPANAQKLLMASYILSGLRFPPDLVDEVFQGVGRMKESSTYQMILAEGRGAGRIEGEAQGRIKEAQKAVLLVGTPRFGAPDEATLARVHAITSLEHLEMLLGHRFSIAASWDELLAE